MNSTLVSPIRRANRPTPASEPFSVVCEVATPRPSGIYLSATEPVEAFSVPSELRPSQLQNVARRELAWFFTSATTVTEASEEAGARIYWWLQALVYAEQQTIALYYDPLPCPQSLEQHWGQGGFALALSYAIAGQWRPYGRPRHSLEREASDQLEEAVKQHGRRVLRHIKTRAEWDFAVALAAYVHVRGSVPCVIPEAA